MLDSVRFAWDQNLINLTTGIQFFFTDALDGSAMLCLNKHLMGCEAQLAWKIPVQAHFFQRAILTRKVGETGLFFDARSWFISFISCFIVTVVIFVACTFVTCFNKDQSINQSIRSHYVHARLQVSLCSGYDLCTLVNIQTEIYTDNFVTSWAKTDSGRKFMHIFKRISQKTKQNDDRNWWQQATCNNKLAT